jgi:hypothetical protein
LFQNKLFASSIHNASVVGSELLTEHAILSMEVLPCERTTAKVSLWGTGATSYQLASAALLAPPCPSPSTPPLLLLLPEGAHRPVGERDAVRLPAYGGAGRAGGSRPVVADGEVPGAGRRRPYHRRDEPHHRASGPAALASPIQCPLNPSDRADAPPAPIVLRTDPAVPRRGRRSPRPLPVRGASTRGCARCRSDGA